MSSLQFTTTDISTINALKRDIVQEVSFALNKLPMHLSEFIAAKGIVTGGITASMLHTGSYNDIDVYLKDPLDIKGFNVMVKDSCMDSVVDQNTYGGPITLPDGKLITANATTFKNKVQVITMATVDHRKTFDFIHCMPWLDLKDRKFYISKMQFDSISNKQLVTNPNKKGDILTHRFNKYLSRGWTLK